MYHFELKYSFFRIPSLKFTAALGPINALTEARHINNIQTVPRFDNQECINRYIFMYPGTIINVDTRFLDTPIIYIGLFILFLWSPYTD